MNRFRTNFVFSNGNPFDEDNWKTIKIGNMVFHSTKPCPRCVIGVSPMVKEQKKAAVRLREQERLTAQITALEANQKRKLKQVQYSMEQDIRAVQDRYKLLAIFVPPIPPLLVALYVFFRRREAEREGIAQSRLR